MDALAAHQGLRLLDFVAAVVERRVPAVRPALLADLVQALGGDGEPEELRLLLPQRLGQLHALEVFRDQRVVGRLHAELQREV